MKILIMVMLLVNSIYANEQNVGFLMNQKYICVIKGAFIENKLVKIMSEEEAMKFPSRFYIDDTFTLHTDGKIDNIFKKIKNDTYQSNESIINLSISHGKRQMIRLALSGQMKGIPLIHICMETSNWTLTK